MSIIQEFERASDEIEKDIKSYDYDNENVIEFIKNCDTITATFSQGRWISKMKKLAQKYPEDVKIVAENKSGSIVVHFPVSYLHISNSKRDMTDEQRNAAAERLRNYHNNKTE